MIDKNTFINIKSCWGAAINNKKFLTIFFAVIIIFAIQMYFISGYQSRIERRPGVQFIDPVFGNTPAKAVDALTFFAIYITHIIAIVAAATKPEKFLQIISGYLLVYFFRIFALYLLPLDPPEGTIPLMDPLLIWFGNGEVITKDLFYSGHTSTTFMVILVTENKQLKYFLLIGLALVIYGVLIQQVHYTVDVYAALFFSYTAYRLTVVFLEKTKLTGFSAACQKQIK